MDALDIAMLAGMLFGWIGVVMAVVIPAVVLDARNSASPRKHERENRAVLATRRSRE